MMLPTTIYSTMHSNQYSVTHNQNINSENFNLSTWCHAMIAIIYTTCDPPCSVDHRSIHHRHGWLCAAVYSILPLHWRPMSSCSKSQHHDDVRIVLMTVKRLSSSSTAFQVVIISITRYRDIDRRFIQRTISWRPYIVRYRARTHVSCVRCSHTAAAASASDWRRSPCTTSVAPSVSRSLR